MLQITSQSHLVVEAAHAVHVLHRDYETRSRAVLKTIGAQRYAADPSTEVLCCAYAVDDGPGQLWRPGDPVPSEFMAAANNNNWVVAAFNDAFEAAIEKQIMAPRYRWPVIPIERHRCVQAQCLALGLPARLSIAADALELTRKDAAGERLMHQMSKPRRPRKDENPDGVYWFEDQERLDRLYSYCAQDVEVERELFHRLPSLSSTEQSIWELSYKINVRGFHIDRTFAEAARRIAEQATPELDREVQELTGGDVTSINQVTRLTAWLQDHGCSLQSLDRKAIERQLQKGEDELVT
jgi:DNA polymerase bacteriophage-type